LYLEELFGLDLLREHHHHYRPYQAVSTRTTITMTQIYYYCNSHFCSILLSRYIFGRRSSFFFRTLEKEKEEYTVIDFIMKRIAQVPRNVSNTLLNLSGYWYINSWPHLFISTSHALRIFCAIMPIGKTTLIEYNQNVVLSIPLEIV
jgi:hypothetical protein